MITTENTRVMFPAGTGLPVFFRTYSQRGEESWWDVCSRCISGLKKLGNLLEEESTLLLRYMQELKSLPSGRWLWVGGSSWVEKPENFSGAYNCTSTNVRAYDDQSPWAAFGWLLDLGMMGCGTGAVLEPKHIDTLPPICNKLNINIQGEPGEVSKQERLESTEIYTNRNTVYILIGDSRKGWVQAYQKILELASDPKFAGEVFVNIYLGNVRPYGERLEGFGGVANPIKLGWMFEAISEVTNAAIGRQLNSLECCMAIDIGAETIVAGNLRRSAGMRQGAWDDDDFTDAKLGLYAQDEQGNWYFPDPRKSVLRIANHTRIFHHKPSLAEVTEAVGKQYHSGEGAIMWAGESVYRANRDLIQERDRTTFLALYNMRVQYAEDFLAVAHLRRHGVPCSEEELEHRLGRVGLNPCGEICGDSFHCNLAEVHLNQVDVQNLKEQEEAFTAGALSVAVLLRHEFPNPVYQRSRELDPIVGVSATGIFDFFVKLFGAPWLRWWEAGRDENWMSGQGYAVFSDDAIGNRYPDSYIKIKVPQRILDYSDYSQQPLGRVFKRVEEAYLSFWREVVEKKVWEYCDRNTLKRPNRCTTIQPSGTKSLLTGASPGWHPPKGQRFIRRITCDRNDPVALACLDYGYKVVPAQGDKDENGYLLTDPFDPRCTEWLVEIPCEVSWANDPGVEDIDVSQFSALAQFNFYMQVQRHYTRHNTSATIELREHEIEPVAQRIYQAIQTDEGYISACLSSRFDDHETFPRLPFEPINKETYQQMVGEVEERRVIADFQEALRKRQQESTYIRSASGPAGCDSVKCLIP